MGEKKKRRKLNRAICPFYFPVCPDVSRLLLPCIAMIDLYSQEPKVIVLLSSFLLGISSQRREKQLNVGSEDPEKRNLSLLCQEPSGKGLLRWIRGLNAYTQLVRK